MPLVTLQFAICKWSERTGAKYFPINNVYENGSKDTIFDAYGRQLGDPNFHVPRPATLTDINTDKNVKYFAFSNSKEKIIVYKKVNFSYDEQTGSGTVSNVQSDWSQTDSTKSDFIKNKPSIPSIEGLASELWVEQQGYLTEHQSLSAYQPKIDSDNKLDYALLENVPTVTGFATEQYVDAVVSGKQTKLAAINAGTGVSITEDADGNIKINMQDDGEGGHTVQPDWNQTDSSQADFIKNKPQLSAYQEKIDSSNKLDFGLLANVPPVSASQIQSDWDQTDENRPDFIKNKPTIDTTACKPIPDEVNVTGTTLEFCQSLQQSGEDAKGSIFSGTVWLTDTPRGGQSDLLVKVINKPSTSGGGTVYRLELYSTNGQERCWVSMYYNGSTSISSGHMEYGTNSCPWFAMLMTPIYRNGYDSDFAEAGVLPKDYRGASEKYVDELVNNLASTDSLSAYQTKIDSEHKLDYSLIANTPSGLATELYVTNSLSSYATELWVGQQGYLTEHQSLSGYQTKIDSEHKLDYSLISNTPSGIATELWVNQQGFLKEHQSLSGYQTKIDSEHKLDYALLENVPAFATETFVSNTLSAYQSKIDSEHKLDYGLLDNVPTGLATETFVSNTLSAYQSKIDSEHKLDYALIDNIPTVSADAGNTQVSDSGNYFSSDNVEGILQEIGSKLDGLESVLGGI